MTPDEILQLTGETLIPAPGGEYAHRANHTILAEALGLVNTKTTYTIEEQTGYILAAEGYALTARLEDTRTYEARKETGHNDVFDRLEITLYVPNYPDRVKQGRSAWDTLYSSNDVHGRSNSMRVSLTKNLSMICREIERRLILPNQAAIAQRNATIQETLERRRTAEEIFRELMQLSELPFTSMVADSGHYGTHCRLHTTEGTATTVDVESAASDHVTFTITLSHVPFELALIQLQGLHCYDTSEARRPEELQNMTTATKEAAQ